MGLLKIKINKNTGADTDGKVELRIKTKKMITNR